MPEVSIVIPVYNAGNVIKQTVQALMRALDSAAVDYEILLRDDGSRDHSLQVLKEVEKFYPRVGISYNHVNAGLGFTLRELFARARGDVVVYCDCDLPFGEKAVVLLMEKILQGEDVVVASRYLGSDHRASIVRAITSRLYYGLCHLLFRILVVDIGSGCVAFRAQGLKNLELKAFGFDIHAEIFVKAAMAGLSIHEISLPARGGRLHTFSITKHGLATVVRTVQLWKQMVFNPLRKV